MHVSEFLDRLYASPRTWRLDDRGRIRDVDGGCPWEHVASSWTLGNSLHLFSFTVGPGNQNDAIWDADDNTPRHDPTIRRALLHACGLTEVP